MYHGTWNVEMFYKRGDIVLMESQFTYFICVKTHTSCNLVYPNSTMEDIYWIPIDNQFLMSMYGTFSPILTWEPTSYSDGFYSTFGNTLNTANINTSANMINTTNTTTSMNTTNTLTMATGGITLPSKPSININPTITLDPFMTAPSYSNSDSGSRKSGYLKRKLDDIERSISDYKKQKLGASDYDSLREKILLLRVDIGTKSFLLDKYESSSRMSGSDYTKSMNWLNCVTSLPFGKYKRIGVGRDDNPGKLKDFFKKVKGELDKSILGLEHVKQEILEFVARKITNPKSKGHVLALCGKAGVGKTKLIKSLASALSLPFHQINFGGINDASGLLGHSETYVGAKPGKIVEILGNAGWMNSIIYLDEIDKISENKKMEINGVLTHLLDEEQNDKFQDHYLSNVPLNLSKVLFVASFNDITNVDPIVLDRMKVIHIDVPSIDDKVRICREKMVPDIIKEINFREDCTIVMEEELIYYIITNICTDDSHCGVRQLKKNIEKLLSRLNYDILIGNVEGLEVTAEGIQYRITRSYIDDVFSEFQSRNKDCAYLSMYS